MQTQTSRTGRAPRTWSVLLRDGDQPSRAKRWARNRCAVHALGGGRVTPELESGPGLAERGLGKGAGSVRQKHQRRCLMLSDAYSTSPLPSCPLSASSPSKSLPFCVSLCLPLSLNLCRFAFHSVSASLFLPCYFSPSVCLPISVSLCLSASLFPSLSTSLSFCLSLLSSYVCLSVSVF